MAFKYHSVASKQYVMETFISKLIVILRDCMIYLLLVLLLSLIILFSFSLSSRRLICAWKETPPSRHKWNSCSKHVWNWKYRPAQQIYSTCFSVCFFPLTTIAICQYAISTPHHFIYSHYKALQDVANDQNL